MTKQRRKPFRRTAWTLLIGGLVTLALMIGTGLLLLAGGEDVGPGRTAVVPAGERVSVHKHPGPGGAEAVSSPCSMQGPSGGIEDRSELDWTESVRSPDKVTIECEQEAILLTGIASVVVSAFQGTSLLAIPLGAIVVGLFLFVPRFLGTMAWLSNPRRR